MNPSSLTSELELLTINPSTHPLGKPFPPMLLCFLLRMEAGLPTHHHISMRNHCIPPCRTQRETRKGTGFLFCCFQATTSKGSFFLEVQFPLLRWLHDNMISTLGNSPTFLNDFSFCFTDLLCSPSNSM